MKMNKLLVILGIVSCISESVAQSSIGIGTTMPSGSSILDLTSTTKGFLVPRMTGAQRAAIGSPATGLLVYQTNSEIIPFSFPGLYIYHGSSWRRLARTDEITGSSWTITGDNQYSNVDGNVGIGTQNPDTKLHILGFAKMSYPTAAGPFLTMETTYLPVPNMPNISGIVFSRNGSWVGSLSYFSPNMIPGNPNAVMTPGILRFSASDPSANDLVITTGGTVGIGTSSNLATRLYIVNGNESSLSTHGYMVLGSVTGANLVMDPNEIQARSNGVASTLRLQQDGGPLLVQGSALVVGSTGNVGIGDLTPDEKLHVAGNALVEGHVDMDATNPTLQLLNDGVEKGFFQLAGNDVRIGTNSANDLGRFIIRTNQTDQVFVNSSGNMGVGTASPLQRLHVSGNAYVSGNLGLGISAPTSKLDVAGRINIDHNGEALKIDGNNSFIQMYQNGVAKSYIQQLGNDLRIGNSTGNSTGRLYLFGDEVAINTNGPANGYSLSVGGEIICEELRVELQGNGPWPDYVFAQDYDLRPLDELKSFISTNKHLPNIPAAAQVEQEGFDVGDMNRRLLEKVEELTLYIIKQQEEIDALKVAVQKINE